MTTTAPQQELTPLPLMQLAIGFWASKALFAAHEIGLFSLLARGDGGTADQVAADLEIAERPAEMLLTACASLGLLDKRDGRYHNSPVAAKYLVPGGPDYFGGFLAFNDKRIYGSYGRLIEAVRSNRPVGWDAATQRSFFDSADTTITRDFYEAMHSLSTPTGQALASVPAIRTPLPAAGRRRRLGRYPHRAVPGPARPDRHRLRPPARHRVRGREDRRRRALRPDRHRRRRPVRARSVPGRPRRRPAVPDLALVQPGPGPADPRQDLCLPAQRRPGPDQ